MSLISNAFSQDLSSGTESDLIRFLPIILMFVLLYFSMIRPNIKRQKDHRNILDAMVKGDEVITNGGILGKVTRVSEDTYIRLEIAEGTEITMQKISVTTILPKGTIKFL